VTDGRALLLPRIVAFGALDETPLALASALEVPPAVDSSERLAVLTYLILRMDGADGVPTTADHAWRLARELASLMDDADRAEIDLTDRLPDAADPAFAAHWARTLTFLRIVSHTWPAWLAEHGVMNPAARQVALLNAQAAVWQAHPPDHPVMIAGTTAGIPAVARLACTVARLPKGAVVLPVLDETMSDEAWNAMEDCHPQAGLGALLAALDATRQDVRRWGTSDDVHDTDVARAARRFDTFSRALLPAASLDSWQVPFTPELNGLWRLRARDPQEEAEAIAMILRIAVETPGRTAALVTADRQLAARVSGALLRHGIVADDSAGEELIETPPAVFLRLLTRAVTMSLAPVPLLALLKHPYAAAGLDPVRCRQMARALEIAALRGPRPSHGVTGLRRRVRDADDAVKEFVSRVEACLAPALRIAAGVVVSPAEALAALIAAGENLAATDDVRGEIRLWAAEEGEALSACLASALSTLPGLPDQPTSVMPRLLDALLEGQVVRSRRVLRGRGGVEHPRVFIWGLLEARLQSADVMVLGSLTESVWPSAPEPGPWLSRPMRATVGLPAPEIEVGQSAHDFLSVVLSAPEVILSCSDRRDGAPAVPARWLTRLEAMLSGSWTNLPSHPAVEWARIQDHPPSRPKPVAPPRPCPPIALRPSQLSVTEIETWLRDPYAIYARHVLRLRKLGDLDEETDAADFGALVHAGLQIFFREHGASWLGTTNQIRRALRRALAESYAREALAAWWEPRLERIAEWIAAAEGRRLSVTVPVAINTEVSGSLRIQRPGRLFRLTGRADRIDHRADGMVAILDYKTGRVPARAEVEIGLAPQLPLEAMIASAGGYQGLPQAITAELVYWQLTGGYEPGKECPVFGGGGDADPFPLDETRRGLERLIDQYDQPDCPYLARPNPTWAPRFSDFAILARVGEWATPGVAEDDT
jgi:ATP-dependent helicase/nuclease subunit B